MAKIKKAGFDAEQMLYEIADQFGDSKEGWQQLAVEMVKAMTDTQAKEILGYIARNWDIETVYSASTKKSKVRKSDYAGAITGLQFVSGEIKLEAHDLNNIVGNVTVDMGEIPYKIVDGFIRELADNYDEIPSLYRFAESHFNRFNESTKKSKSRIRKDAYTKSMKGRTVFFHGTEYRITDVDLVGSNTNQKGEYGGQYKVYLMDARGKTYLVPILIPRGKEDKITSEDDWTEYIDIDWGDIAETSPEDWTIQSYYYEHYGIEPHFDVTFDIDTIKRALNVPDEFIRSIRQISEDKIEVEFDDSDWYYEHIPDNALYQAGYYYEWYDSYILNIYPNDDSYRKSTKKSKKPDLDISFEASVNSLRKTNYAKCGNINTIVKERK